METAYFVYCLLIPGGSRESTPPRSRAQWFLGCGQRPPLGN